MLTSRLTTAAVRDGECGRFRDWLALLLGEVATLGDKNGDGGRLRGDTCAKNGDGGVLGVSGRVGASGTGETAGTDAAGTVVPLMGLRFVALGFQANLFAGTLDCAGFEAAAAPVAGAGRAAE